MPVPNARFLARERPRPSESFSVVRLGGKTTELVPSLRPDGIVIDYNKKAAP